MPQIRPRRFGMLLLVAATCRPATSSEPASPPVSAPRDAVETVPRMAWLDLFESVGLPDIHGWTRVERAGAGRRGRACHRAWVQPVGSRQIAFTDDLHFDYGGTWFAQWPAHARTQVGAYDLVKPPKRRASVRVSPDEAFDERPSNLLMEAIAETEGKPQECTGSERPIVASVARASWVRALGHRDLARSMVAAWPSEWTEDALRTALARTLIETSDSALRQGAPRSLVRPWLSWAAAEGRGPSAEGAKRALELLGDDTPSGRTNKNCGNSYSIRLLR